MAIAQNTRKLCLPAQSRHQLFRETGNAAGKIAPIESDRHTGDFPVPGWRVLSLGPFDRAAMTALRLSCIKPGRHSPGCQATGFSQAEFRKVGNMQPPPSRTGVAVAAGTGFR